MKENLEKYLKEKRQNLDVDLPDDDFIWQGIQSGMKKKRTIGSNIFWKAAAILLFVVSTTYVVYNEVGKRTPQVTLASISPELQEQEAELIQTAQNKWKIIQASNDDLTQLQFLFKELDDLEGIYKSYEKDLNEVGANEFIVRALLDYHSKKIRILDNILHEIEKQKNYENTEFVEL